MQLFACLRTRTQERYLGSVGWGGHCWVRYRKDGVEYTADRMGVANEPAFQWGRSRHVEPDACRTVTVKNPKIFKHPSYFSADSCVFNGEWKNPSDWNPLTIPHAVLYMGIGNCCNYSQNVWYEYTGENLSWYSFPPKNPFFVSPTDMVQRIDTKNWFHPSDKLGR